MDRPTKTCKVQLGNIRCVVNKFCISNKLFFVKAYIRKYDNHVQKSKAQRDENLQFKNKSFTLKQTFLTTTFEVIRVAIQHNFCILLFLLLVLLYSTPVLIINSDVSGILKSWVQVSQTWV